MNPEEIFITPYGTITLDWDFNTKNSISIEIGKTKIGFLSETEDGENPYDEAINFEPKNLPNSILEAFDKIFSTKISCVVRGMFIHTSIFIHE